jgi:hypothetical protein
MSGTSLVYCIGGSSSIDIVRTTTSMMGTLSSTTRYQDNSILNLECLSVYIVLSPDKIYAHF